MDLAPHIRISTIAQLSRGAGWRLSMLHDRPQHLLFWITKGQGVAVVQGRRRGVGAHNALFLPAQTLFSLDLGHQGFGQVLTFPATTSVSLPRSPVHLRVRDVTAQAELTGLIEAMQREDSGTRPFANEALDAYGALVAVWLHRQGRVQAPACPRIRPPTVWCRALRIWLHKTSKQAAPWPIMQKRLM